MVHFAKVDSPVGPLLLEGDGAALTGLRPLGNWEGECSSDPVLEQAKFWLQAYFRGEIRPVPFGLAPKGTDFQKTVWALLAQIPYGETRTYGDLARQLGKARMSAQAVGQAVGRNPICILIPCHRVIGAGGKLTGYAWGLEMKKKLLRHEGHKEDWL